MDNLQIREAEPSDIPGMVRLLEQLFSLEEDFAFDPELHTRAFQRLLGRCGTENIALVARDDSGFIAGMLTVQTVVSTAVGTLSGWVEDVIVDESWRDRKLGSSLLAEAERWADQNGVARLQLLADKHNGKALDFYTSRGWEASGWFIEKK